MLTAKQAHSAAKLALESSLGQLVYRSAGSADVRIGHCHVKGRRASCPARVSGTVTCRVRMRVLVAGSLPASSPESQLSVWADRVSCV